MVGVDTKCRELSRARLTIGSVITSPERSTDCNRVMVGDFDLNAVYEAVEARRVVDGLSWAELARVIGVSASTVRGMRNGRNAEGDGVLAVLRWLGRTPESFMTGNANNQCALPEVAGGGVLRFDARRIYGALDGRRREQGLTWNGLAVEIGAESAASLTGLRRGGRVRFPAIMRVFAWLNEPAARFVSIARQ